MRLPTMVVGAEQGHGHDHAILKAEYDERHPDAPLPELGGGLINGRQSHDVIHELLAVDYNANSGGDLPTELPPALPQENGGLVKFVGSPMPGHIFAHNALHTAYNRRMGEG